MRLALFALLLCSTATVRAQGVRAHDSIPAFVPPSSLSITRITNSSCPVGMKADRQASPQREWVVSLEDSAKTDATYESKRSRAGVRVELVGISRKSMSQAEVAVYYLAPGIRALPVRDAALFTTSASALKKTFVLSSAGASSSMQLTGNLLIGPSAEITHVRLLSITYSDGTTWRSNEQNNCTVTPGLLLLVAGR